MKAIITGATSGIGRDMARVLSKMGYDILAVGRREERLLELRDELLTNVETVVCDVTDIEQCKSLCKRAKESDILINCAGFGVFGKFLETDLQAELDMIDTNLKAVHILTKGFAAAYKEKGGGYILNVASLAAFFPGPLFGAYYASKAYVLRLSQAVAEEMRKDKTNVKISVLCPGPVKTEFEDRANVFFGTGEEGIARNIILKSPYVAKYAIDKMFKGKEVIIPGFLMKIAVFMRHLLPDKLLSKAVYFVQSKKMVKR